ncbi:MAG: toprim domain-containing protein [Myxococcaceae bacterium]|nr:toprim domain-containing protein [Myxococcaceae bacterium]MBH2006081.1 toprim domain-containing protein [Myxococcaceae bacterium]
MKLEDAIAEIKRRTDLVQVIGRTVKLKKQGPSYLGLCPFHAEKSPSFNVRPDKGFFKCFGCGASGDVFSFLEKQSGQLFMDIVRQLAAEHGIVIQGNAKTRVDHLSLDALERDQSYFLANLKDEPLRYLTQVRRYPTEFIEKMGLGFGANSDSLFHSRITIPIRNPRGQIIGFGGRIFGNLEKTRPKYVNSSSSEVYDKSQTLYGLYESLPLIKKQSRVMVVEGYFDVMAFLASGIPAVAPCGTSLTQGHASLIQKYTQEVVLCFDRDPAGVAAQEKALLLFLANGFQVRTAEMLDKDPDSLWQKGEYETLKGLLSNAKDAVQVRIEQASSDGMIGVHARIQALQALLPVLSVHPDPLVNRQYVRLASSILKEDERVLIQSVLKARPGALPKAAAPISREIARVVWSASEKLLFAAFVQHPALVHEASDIVAELNSDFAFFMDRVMELPNQKGWSDIVLPRHSTVVYQLKEVNVSEISRQEAELILQGWRLRVQKKKKNAWLSEQHKRLLQASSEGNLQEVRDTLKSQTGALKQGWT